MTKHTYDLNFDVPDVFKPLFTAPKRKNILQGGRGSGKSHQVARYIILRALEKKTLILCTRELQNTIADSVHALLKKIMEDAGLAGRTGAFFEVQRDRIIAKNGSRFIFTGVRNNVNEIKSMEGVDICWVEEAQAMSQTSLDVLIPTIRSEGSILIFTYNPFKDSDPVHQMALNPDNDTLVIKANYSDNPFFPDVLRKEMERDKRVDYDKYLWVWEGQCLGISAAQIFRGKYEVRAFETPATAILRYGADWGFSNDPTTLVRSFIIGNTLYIDYCAGEVGVDIKDTPELFNKVPGSRLYPIYADAARPETISAMQHYGYQCVAADKWQGSVEDGISYLRSFDKIVIHPRCEGVIQEFDLYQFKVDRQTNEVLREPVDKYNHYIDALRYSHANSMRAENGGKVYNEFTIANVVPAAPYAAGTVYVGTYVFPGRTYIIGLQVMAGCITICMDYELHGGIDFNKIKQLFPLGTHLVWLPYCKLEEVPPNLVQECIALDIEPAVGSILPTENEGAVLINRLFMNNSLKVMVTASLTTTALTERVYQIEGKLENTKQIDKYVLFAALVEYAVWRVHGRM